MVISAFSLPAAPPSQIQPSTSPTKDLIEVDETEFPILQPMPSFRHLCRGGCLFELGLTTILMHNNYISSYG